MKIAGLTNNQVRPQDFKEITMTKTLDTVEEAIKAIANAAMPQAVLRVFSISILCGALVKQQTVSWSGLAAW